MHATVERHPIDVRHAVFRHDNGMLIAFPVRAQSPVHDFGSDRPTKGGDIVSDWRRDTLGFATLAGADFVAGVHVDAKEIDGLTDRLHFRLSERGGVFAEKFETVLGIMTLEDRVHPPGVVPAM